MLKKLYNLFVYMYYIKELEDAKEKLSHMGYIDGKKHLDELKNKIHPKTDAIVNLEKWWLSQLTTI